MEAKGCAKPMVWKNARRHFYWAVRARIARSSALSQLEEASPRTTFEYRTQLLETLACIDASTPYQAVAESLEALDLKPTVARLKSDHLIQQVFALTHENRKVTIDGLVRFINDLADEDRSSLMAALQTPNLSPGESSINPDTARTQLT
jgi:acetyl-CoA carboxylase / biotin carboxylase 1